MYPFIVCFCGRSLGDLYDAFKLMRLAKYNAAFEDIDYDIDPALLAISETVEVDMSDVFEQLNICMDCCKIHLNTQVEFKDIY